MISEESIIAVKSAANIVEIIGNFLKLKREGADYVSKCPFHTEKDSIF
jgi:DNA primase